MLANGGGGSGLDFSIHDADKHKHEHGSQRDPLVSASCYTFKPLDAPNGVITIKVTFRRGVDPKVR